MSSRPGVLAVPALALVLSLTGLPPVAGAAAPAGPKSPHGASLTVVLAGHGWGHGRGLGQYGAYGYAVDHGWSAARILAHYYGGTRAGQMGRYRYITVRLSSLEGPASPLRSTGSWITSSQAFTVGNRRVAGGSAARIAWSGHGWQIFTASHGCAAGQAHGPVTVSSPAVSTVASPGNDPARMLTVCTSGRSYRGTLRVVRSQQSVLMVNWLPMESYLRGVVPSESPAGWGDGGGGRGMAALQAQAVAARSYALAENRYPPYAKTCDTTSCQVYAGAAEHGVPVEDPRTDRAVTSTSRQVRLDARNRVVRTEFSSSTGGWTDSGGLWPAVRDLGDSASPQHTWRATLSGQRLAGRYGVGTFRRVVVTAQNGLGAGGGRAERVRVVGSAGSRTMSGSQFAADWGLNSDWFLPVGQRRP